MLKLPPEGGGFNPPKRRQQHKPYQLIDGSEVLAARAAQIAYCFVRSRSIEVLNVAGPRARKCPEVYAYVFEAVTLLLQQL